MKPYTALLVILNSKRDSAGNSYYAFRYVDCETGKVVCGRITGGYSNIDCSRCYMTPNGEFQWQSDSAISIETQELNIREFNREVKNFSYAGCTPQEIAKFIKTELAK